MKQYFVYFVDHKNDNLVSIKGIFESEILANENIETLAFKYIKKLQGTEQMNICKKDKNEEELKNDITIKDGLYTQVVNKKVHIYEKSTQIHHGWVKNNIFVSVTKVGFFAITDFVTDAKKIPIPPKNLMKIIKQEPIKIEKRTNNSFENKDKPCIQMSLIEELKKKQSHSGMKLNPVKQETREPLPKPYTFLDDFVDNFDGYKSKLNNVVPVVKSIPDIIDDIYEWPNSDWTLNMMYDNETNTKGSFKNWINTHEFIELDDKVENESIKLDDDKDEYDILFPNLM